MWPIDASMKINIETESSFSLTPALATLKPQAGMAVSVPAATPVQVGNAYLLLTENFVSSINLNVQSSKAGQAVWSWICWSSEATEKF